MKTIVKTILGGTCPFSIDKLEHFSLAEFNCQKLYKEPAFPEKSGPISRVGSCVTELIETQPSVTI